MATIIENNFGRRIIKLSTDDVISIVKEYQNITTDLKSCQEIRNKLNKEELYLPEEYYQI